MTGRRMAVLLMIFVIGASAIAKELPIIDANAAIPEIFLYLHLPTMLVMIGLFMVYIIRAVKKGHFERWNGYTSVSYTHLTLPTSDLV